MLAWDAADGRALTPVIVLAGQAPGGAARERIDPARSRALGPAARPLLLGRQARLAARATTRAVAAAPRARHAAAGHRRRVPRRPPRRALRDRPLDRLAHAAAGARRPRLGRAAARAVRRWSATGCRRSARPSARSASCAASAGRCPLPLRAQLVDQQAALAGSGAVRPGERQGDLRHGRVRARPHRGAAAGAAGCCRPSPGPRRRRRSVGEIAHALDGGVFAAGSLLDWLAGDLGLAARRAGARSGCRAVADSAGVMRAARARRARRAVVAAGGARRDRRAARAASARRTSRARRSRRSPGEWPTSSRRWREAVEPVAALRVDGGLTNDATLLQLQADALGLPLAVGPRGRDRARRGDARGRRRAACSPASRTPQRAARGARGASRAPTRPSARRSARALARVRARPAAAAASSQPSSPRLVAGRSQRREHLLGVARAARLERQLDAGLAHVQRHGFAHVLDAHDVGARCARPAPSSSARPPGRSGTRVKMRTRRPSSVSWRSSRPREQAAVDVAARRRSRRWCPSTGAQRARSSAPRPRPRRRPRRRASRARRGTPSRRRSRPRSTVTTPSQQLAQQRQRELAGALDRDAVGDRRARARPPSGRARRARRRRARTRAPARRSARPRAPARPQRDADAARRARRRRRARSRAPGPARPRAAPGPIVPWPAITSRSSNGCTKRRPLSLRCARRQRERLLDRAALQVHARAEPLDARRPSRRGRRAA